MIKMTTFTVNFGQGNIEKREAESAWELATELTNEGLPYNQSSIKVLDENEEEVILIADWYGVSPEEDDEVLEEIGGGFYTPWREI